MNHETVNALALVLIVVNGVILICSLAFLFLFYN